MKMYFEKNNTRTGYSPIGRYKQVYFNADTTAYFKWNGRRVKLDDIPALTYPVMLDDEYGKIIVLGGYITLSNTCGLLVEIDTDYQAVRLWQEIEL